MNKIIPVILSGGAGTRLWPLSRESHPKPFLPLSDGQSLLQKTFLRALQLPHIHTLFTITNHQYYLKSKMEYEKIAPHNTIPLQFLLEPESRNTGSAIALATLAAEQMVDEDAILFILPADHFIQNTSAFLEASTLGIAQALQNHIVTFGIPPTTPETGFGYIEYQKDTLTVKQFIEKPDLATATTYLATGNFLWNAGIFCAKARVLLQTLREHANALLHQAEACYAKSSTKNMALTFDRPSFTLLPNISIDSAIIEKARDLVVIPCQFDWQDVGSFASYQKLFPRDAQNNATVGEVITKDAHNNFIHSENRLIAAIGIHNLVVIDTQDALLITPCNRTQEVKEITQQLKAQTHPTAMLHQTVHRPWGSYTLLEEGLEFKIKHITVNPHAALSLQKHQHRSEHWVVVQGTAHVINGDKEYILKKNESTFIPAHTQHRLSNKTNDSLIIIEVQAGRYVGEDDIIRLEDKYERV